MSPNQSDNNKHSRAAIIGCGRIGSLFDTDKKRKIISSHSGAYYNHPKTKLVSVCDTNLDKVLLCKKQWNVDSHYLSYQEMLKKETIDILSICTYPNTHEKIINTALQYDLKAIFCEKPISNDLMSAQRIVSKCKERNVILAVNHYRRWDEFFIKLKDDIFNNKFGKLQHINFYYTRGIANSGSHLFDLLRFLFGNIESINVLSSIEEIENDPTLSCTLEIENGLICNLIGLDGRYYGTFDLEIFGSTAKILIDISKRIRYYKSSPSKRSSEFNELYDTTYPKYKIQNKQIFINTLSNIIDSIENKSPILCAGTDGYKSLELIIASKLSYELQQKIKLPLKQDYYNKSI